MNTKFFLVLLTLCLWGDNTFAISQIEWVQDECTRLIAATYDDKREVAYFHLKSPLIVDHSANQPGLRIHVMGHKDRFFLAVQASDSNQCFVVGEELMVEYADGSKSTLKNFRENCEGEMVAAFLNSADVMSFLDSFANKSISALSLSKSTTHRQHLSDSESQRMRSALRCIRDTIQGG